MSIHLPYRTIVVSYRLVVKLISEIATTSKIGTIFDSQLKRTIKTNRNSSKAHEPISPTIGSVENLLSDDAGEHLSPANVVKELVGSDAGEFVYPTVSSVENLHGTEAKEPLSSAINGVENLLDSGTGELFSPTISGIENLLGSDAGELLSPTLSGVEFLLGDDAGKPLSPAVSGVEKLSGRDAGEPLSSTVSGIEELPGSDAGEPLSPTVSSAENLVSGDANEECGLLSLICLKNRSWSLSDLTQDTNCVHTGSLRRTQSLTDNPLDSSPLLISLYKNVSSENDYYPSNDHFTESSTDCEVEAVQEYGNMNEGRKCRHVPDPNSWKRNLAKTRRMRGEEYLGYTKPKDGKFQHNKLRFARKLGETCLSDFCKKSKLRGCSQFTEDQRKIIHTYFWKNLSWDQRKIYITSLVTRSDTSRKTKKNTDSRRDGTLSYFLPLKRDCSQKIQVCRKMFLSTFSLGSFTVQSWVKKSEFGMTPDQTIKTSLNYPRPQNLLTKRKMLTVENFLDRLPKMPSHYARKGTNKLYIEPMYHSLVELYKA